MSKLPARKYICPSCGERSGVDIVYGYPGSIELLEQVERGEVALGGCCITIGESPERKCTSCEHKWRIKRRKVGFDQVEFE